VKLGNLLALTLCFILNIHVAGAEEMKMELIPLHYRNVEEIIPIIQPLIHKGGSLSGMNNQLIVKTTATNLGEIKQILAEIDKAARRLLITVRQDVDGDINTQEHGVSGRYTRGDISVSSGNKRDNDRGLVLSAKDDEGNNIRYRNLSTRSDLDDKNTFQIQTVDGKAAYIQTGQQVPIANRNAYLGRSGVVVQDTVEYHDVSSGFYVLPRVNGDRVTLLVSPHLSRVQPNQTAVFEVQNAETTTIGRLGEWLQIGGVTQHFNSNQRDNLRNTRQSGQEQRTILIKVDEIL
jgi:type II secretory pathway component GspD/PulD (secretin)